MSLHLNYTSNPFKAAAIGFGTLGIATAIAILTPGLDPSIKIEQTYGLREELNSVDSEGYPNQEITDKICAVTKLGKKTFRFPCL